MNTNHLLIGLVAVQTAAILFLVVQVNALQARTNEIASAQYPAIETASTPTTEASMGHIGLTATETRNIIREELSALSDIRNSEAATSQRAGIVGNDMTPEEIQALKATISSQINNLSAIGTASRSDIAAVEQNIARLPAGERQQALGRLFRAINQGNIDTRL